MHHVIPLALLLATAVGPSNQQAVPKVGDPAPAFELRDQDERKVTLESLAGKRFVLAFYPKDFTPG